METNLTLPCLSNRLCGFVLKKPLVKADCAEPLPQSCIIDCSTDRRLKPPPMRATGSDSRLFQRKQTKMMAQRIGGQLGGQLLCVLGTYLAS